MLPGGAQAGFAIASILQIILVALAFLVIFASWRENAWLIHFSAWLAVAHFVFDLITLVSLLVVVGSSVSCEPPAPPPSTPPHHPCSKLVAAKPVWDVLSALILAAQLYLSVIVFSYSIYIQDHSRRPYIPEISTRRPSTPLSHGLDRKRLLSTSESYPNVELSAVEPATATRSFAAPPGTGYGGGMRTYEEAEENEKARLRREMESGERKAASFPIPSTSGTGILTPLGLEWRDGDLPPYAS